MRLRKSDCIDYMIGLAVAIFAALMVGWSADAKATEKVEICHRTHGTNEYVTIEVAPASVEAHLAHGDYIGECDDSDSDTDTDSDSGVDTGYPVEPPHSQTIAVPVETGLKDWVQQDLLLPIFDWFEKEVLK